MVAPINNDDAKQVHAIVGNALLKIESVIPHDFEVIVIVRKKGTNNAAIAGRTDSPESGKELISVAAIGLNKHIDGDTT